MGRLTLNSLMESGRTVLELACVYGRRGDYVLVEAPQEMRDFYTDKSMLKAAAVRLGDTLSSWRGCRYAMRYTLIWRPGRKHSEVRTDDSWNSLGFAVM